MLEFRFDPLQSSPVRRRRRLVAASVRRLVMSERQVMGDGDEGEMGSGLGEEGEGAEWKGRARLQQDLPAQKPS